MRIPPFIPRCVVVVFLVCNAAPALFAQGRAAALATGEAPAPVSPEVVSRDTGGHVTVRAVRVASSMRIDGRLDESAYESTPSVSDFLQQEPNEGQPATEKTEAWVFFDDRNIYVSARCWDTQPGRRVANEMRRDTAQLRQNDTFGVLLDTFHVRHRRPSDRGCAAQPRVRDQGESAREILMAGLRSIRTTCRRGQAGLAGRR